MPRGRRSRRTGSNNIQTKLTTRLMQISLSMDDHIYCSRPVSRATAEALLQEVTTLKLKCPRSDVRTLQVIAKVTQFMKTIIAEDQELETDLPKHFSSIPACTGFSQTHSPVYSLSDEDRLETETFCGSPEDIPTVDITADSTSSCCNNAIENVNDAISNMAIRDEIVVLSDDDCSQSILDNYQDENHTCAETVQGNYTPHIKNQITTELCDIPLNNTSPTKRIENRTPDLFDLSKENVVTNFIMDKHDVPVTEEMNNVVQLEKSIDAKKAPRKKKRKHKHIKNDEAAGTSSKTNIPRKEKKAKIKNKENRETNILKNVKPADMNLPIIYNQNVENDLSWVENLRFVREIGSDENDPSLCNLEENFWDNFSLPSQWNDDDFDY